MAAHPSHHETNEVTQTNIVNDGLTAIRMCRNEIDKHTERQQHEHFATHFGPTHQVCVLIRTESFCDYVKDRKGENEGDKEE